MARYHLGGTYAFEDTEHESVSTERLYNDEEPNIDRSTPIWLVDSTFYHYDFAIQDANIEKGVSGSGSITQSRNRIQVETLSTSSSTATAQINHDSRAEVIQPDFDHDNVVRLACWFPSQTSAGNAEYIIGNQTDGFGIRHDGSDVIVIAYSGGGSPTTATLSTGIGTAGGGPYRLSFTAGTDIQAKNEKTGDTASVSSGLPSGDLDANRHITIHAENNGDAANMEINAGRLRWVMLP